jgi:hypothetical protein
LKPREIGTGFTSRIPVAGPQKEVNLEIECFLSGGDMNTGCETRISEELGDPRGAADSGEANSAPVRAQKSARNARAALRPELRLAGTFTVFARQAGPRNHTAGESHVRSKHADEVVDHAFALHAAGTSASQIARELGIARRTIRCWLTGRRRHPPVRRSNTRRSIDFVLPRLIGLAELRPSPPRRRVAYARTTVDEARRLHALGHSHRNIAGRLGVPRATLWYWLTDRRRHTADPESPTK